MRLRSLGLLATMAIAAGSCVDHEAAAPSLRGLLHLSLSASVSGSAAGRVVDVRVFYLRPPSEQVSLLSQAYEVEGGAKELPVAVDIGPCLTDASREGSGSGQRCLVRLAVVLRDAAGAPIDSVGLGPIDASPGATVTVPSLTLSEETTIAVVSGGDQIGFAGQPLLLPVDVRVTARGGVPLADRPITVSAVSGGGSLVTQPSRTNAEGVARFSYHLGATAGVNTFRVTAPGLSGAETVVSSRGILPARSAIAAGTVFTCLLDSNRRTRCAGDNSYGALGNPAVAQDTTLFVPVASSVDFVSIAAGNQNNVASRAACGLTADGDVYCWGSNTDGMLGVSAAETCTPYPGSAPGPCARIPTLVPGAPKLAMVSVGGGATLYTSRVCGVTIAGEAYCWGEGDNGELGNGASVSTSSPVRVSGPEKYVQVSTGQTSTCGLAATGIVYCWGSNTFGQLGNGGTTSSAAPVAVTTPARFVSVTVGAHTACGVTTDQRVLCWGQALVVGLPVVPTPTQFAGSTGFASVSLGSAHACGLTPDGDAYCAGSGATGVLGNGLNAATLVPTPVLGGLRFRELSTGTAHTCGVTFQADLYCWGSNLRGELANGSRFLGPFLVPTRSNLTGSAPGLAVRIDPASATDLGAASVGSSSASTRGSIQSGLVRVSDANGVGVQGVAVSYVVVAGGGSLQPTSVITNASGFAAAPGWRLGQTPGLNSITASVQGLAGSPVTFGIQAVRPGSPARIECQPCFFSSLRVVAGTSILQNGFGVPGVIARDANGLVVANTPVTFTVRKPGAQITPASPAVLPTNSEGYAAVVDWKLAPVPGADTLVATVPGLDPVFFVVTPVAQTSVAGDRSFELAPIRRRPDDQPARRPRRP